ncbi:Predicted dehydrogenase [Actinomyces ruminicola]|uniref:Predicted dehydrogenase n=1 Tax=Actinomyces ruminicola TaxID=332524 RepID=A0A1H0F759_9ACTO|nr:Gfo/Idh/MocA family oxidoreductase [Actinomyces ruminicola]SDN90463.1 Predicted dehydrogenase [Actinomyces ruminicola]
MSRDTHATAHTPVPPAPAPHYPQHPPAPEPARPYSAPMPDQSPAPPPGGPVRFGVVGAGWRARFFLRLAAMAPERLECVGALARRSESRAALAQEFGVAVTDSLDGLLARSPELVLPLVSWAAAPGLIRELVGHRIPVLAETPPAPDPDSLRALWHDVGDSGLVQVAEQYPRMPGHAARLAAIRAGTIGTPTWAQVSSTHGYHAVSLLRHFLADDGAPLAGPVTVTARSFPTPLLQPLDRDGWNTVPAVEPGQTVLAALAFDSGRTGVYEFTSNQWHNPLLSRRVLVRGTLGEIVDDAVTRWVPDAGAVTSRIEYRRTGRDLNLEGNDLVHASLDGRVVYRNPWVGTRMSEDDLAVATILQDTGRWAREEGPAPYPLAQACQDHLLSCAIDEAVASGRDVTADVEDWA